MKILKIIHGYPPLFNAGSEVYSQSICNELAKKNQVLVFTREENPFKPDFSLRKHKQNHNLEIAYINNSNGKDGYRHIGIDKVFKDLVEEYNPDLAHIGHLNHLSTGIIDVLHELNIPTVFTLHDFWLMCPRGQFLTRSIGKEINFKVCDGQSNGKCASDCYQVYHSGRNQDGELDLEFWTNWVARRMNETRSMISKVNHFIAPSNYLKDRFISEFGIPAEKISYLDYGFPLSYLTPSNRKSTDVFTFGYIGTHIPAKGINLLIEAFSKIQQQSKLIIFGREKAPFTRALKEIAQNSINPIEFRSEYDNKEIVPVVFEQIDAIVVPSIWTENSPLVIHEAQACQVPVITANFGGMKEYVSHQVNGLLFKHRDVDSIREQLLWAIDHSHQMSEFGKKGYLHSENGAVISIEDHCESLMNIYHSVQNKFWRLTLDTNPEDCNLSCTMCEEHSPFSVYIKTKLNGKRRRMPELWLEEIFTQAADLGVKEIIPSTMGEPVLYKYFVKIVELCGKHGILMNLTTNGTFPKISGKTVDKWAELIIPITSDIKFSWNGATAATSEKVMTGIDFQRTKDNVRTFVAKRNEIHQKTGHYCRLTFQLTFLEDNMHELGDMIKLAAEMDIDRVKGHHLWTHFEEIDDQNLRRGQESIDLWNGFVVEAIQSADINLRPNGKRVILENIYPLKWNEKTIVSEDLDCPFLGKELWMSATGKYSPCCAPDEQRQSLGDFGSFPEVSVEQVMNSPEYLDLTKNYKERALCKNCLMRK